MTIKLLEAEVTVKTWSRIVKTLHRHKNNWNFGKNQVLSKDAVEIGFRKSPRCYLQLIFKFEVNT